ncbi:MAG: HD family phosphohydrolase [Acidobacteriota bacterium]
MTRKSSRLRARRGRKNWSEQLWAFLSYDLLWTCLAVVAIILVVAPQVGLRLRSYSPGDIAVADVTAPTDFQVRDPISTEERQAAAAERVGDVYDFDPTAWQSAFSALNPLFSWGRRARQDSELNWQELPEEQRKAIEAEALAAAGRSLPDGLVAALWRDGFSVGTELRLAGSIKKVLSEHLVGTLVPTPSAAAANIVVRDTSTQQERPLRDPATVLELSDARQLLGAEISASLELPEAAEDLLFMLASTLLRPNLTYNSNDTQVRRQQAVDSVAPVFYQVKRGRRLLRAGDEVTEQDILELQAMREALGSGRPLVSIAGTALLVVLAVVSLWRYVLHYRRRFRYQRVRRLYLLTLSVLVGMVVATRVSLFVGRALANSMAQEPFNIVEGYRFAIPLAAGGMLLLLLVDTQIAWAFSAVFALIVGAMTQDLALTLYTLVGSFAGIYGMSDYKQRTALLQTGFLVGGVNVVAVLGLALLAQPPAPVMIIGFEALCAFAGGVLVSMLATLALPPLEHFFQSMTDIKLLELSNMNLPLLKQLAVEAPGTYHHSVVMGTLAEKAAEAIDVNPLFTRVAAYYHDIGKRRQPQYFVENQKDGRNPHEKLSPSMSVLILVNHVKEGVAYAEEHGLPQPLVDMIPQHHGTRLIVFFFEKAKRRADPDNQVNPEEFRYPGPRPQSKEAAILMLADSVEAVSRTLADPTPARLQAMIDKTIREITDDGQLNECAITMADLSRISDAFLNVLTGMHHQRIEYPSAEEPEEAPVTFPDENRDAQLPGQTYH